MAVLKGYIKSINYGIIESALFGIAENHAREYGARIKERTKYMHGAFDEAKCEVLGFDNAKDAFDCQEAILAEI